MLVAVGEKLLQQAVDLGLAGDEGCEAFDVRHFVSGLGEIAGHPLLHYRSVGGQQGDAAHAERGQGGTARIGGSGHVAPCAGAQPIREGIGQEEGRARLVRHLEANGLRQGRDWLLFL